MAPTGRAPDVVVVGGGLVGTSLAYELVQAGAVVTVVDRHDPGRATDAGAGILSPETNQDPDPGFFAFGLAAARHHRSLTDRLLADGATDTGLAVTGSLLVVQRPEEDEFMERAARLIDTRSPGLVEAVDPHDVARYFPPLGPVHRALYSPVARRIDGRVLTAALQAAAVARGARWHDASVVEVVLDRSRRTATGVATRDGTVPAGAVVIAGGAWSPQLGAAFGVDLPVVPLKGQIIHLDVPDVDSSAWTIVQPLLSFYLVPWPDGRVACGGTMEAAAGFDHRVTADGVHQLLHECLRTAPGLAGAGVAEVRVGSRPATPDHRPVLGRLPGWENAYVATGHGAEGLLLGPLSARLVARSVLGDEDRAGGGLAAQVLGLCAPGRFAASS
jgi:D-amino-acid dehydrogenase